MWRLNVLVMASAICCFSALQAIREVPGAGWDLAIANDISEILPLKYHGNKTYYFGVYFTATWLQAQQFCKIIHMDMLSIRSQDENSWISQNLINLGFGNEYWIGSSKLTDGVDWLWMSYGDPLDFIPWAPGQPSGGEYCTEMYQRVADDILWNDRSCDTQFHFICERYNDGLPNYCPTT